jgi:L-aspartate oxidase
MYALKMAEHGTVGVLTKRELGEANTTYAQGGIAAVMDGAADSFDEHVKDTIVAGDGLNDPEVVRICVEEGPARLHELVAMGVDFTRKSDAPGAALDLTREGGHSQRRVVHAKDMTGAAVMTTLLAQARSHPNIQFFEDHHAVDLITKHRLGINDGDRCLGAYVLDTRHGTMATFLGRVVLLATGGAGKAYRYTSNPDVATGDGIAMAWRAGAQVANMEFFQFHPTCLFHPKAKNFLITEACRGEGGILRTMDGEAFMARYHEMRDLAPRDVVARAIDRELKRSGDPHVLLDMTHRPPDFLTEHFPGVNAKLLELGIDMRSEPIPVVPAAHYCCGGVVSDAWGRSTLPGLLIAGETSHTGLHGANRLASNSILEALVFAQRAATISAEVQAAGDVDLHPDIPDWAVGFATDPDENVLVAHAWEEIRSLMWNYVGIVRSNKRLRRAQRRLDLLSLEIQEDYWSFKLSPDLIELRNIETIASLVVQCALIRRESRGLHFTVDYPDRDDANWLRDTVLCKGRRS